MTKQEFQEFYGLSVYEVRLRMIEHYWRTKEQNDFFEAVRMAEEFVSELLEEEAKELRGKWTGAGNKP